MTQGEGCEFEPAEGEEFDIEGAVPLEVRDNKRPTLCLFRTVHPRCCRDKTLGIRVTFRCLNSAVATGLLPAFGDFREGH